MYWYGYVEHFVCERAGIITAVYYPSYHKLYNFFAIAALLAVGQGNFAVTFDIHNIISFLFCFGQQYFCSKLSFFYAASHIRSSREVKLVLKHGSEAKDYDRVSTPLLVLVHMACI